MDLSGDSHFVLSWTGFVPVATRDGITTEIKLPYLAEQDEMIGLQSKNLTKTFERGTRINVSAEEFAQICWTLFNFSVSCAQKLEVHGRDMGLKIDPPKQVGAN